MEKKPKLLSRLFGSKPKEEEPVEQPLVDEKSVPMVAETLAHTFLSFTPEQEKNFTAKQKQQLNEKLKEMPKLVLGHANFLPFEAKFQNGEYYVKLFIRNGIDVDQRLKIDQIGVGLIDAEGECVARGVFQLTDFGELMFGESRYWIFLWTKPFVLKPNANLSEYGLQIFTHDQE